MKIGKLEKIDTDNYGLGDLTQDINLQQLIESAIQQDPSLIQGQDGKIDPDKLNALINNITTEIANSSVYSQILNSRVYLGSTKTFDKNDVDALKQSNRDRVKSITDELNALEEKLLKEIENINYYLEYDEDNTDYVFFAKYFLPDHTVGKLTHPEYEILKNITNQSSEFIADNSTNKFNKKIGKPQIDIGEKYSELLTTVEAYQVLKAFQNPADINAVALAGAVTTAQWQLQQKKDKLSKLFDYSFSWTKDGAALINNIEENRGTIDQESLTEKVSLIPILDETRNLKAGASAASKILSGLDEQTSVVDNIAKAGKIKSKVGNRTIEAAPIKDCWECFGDSWKFPKYDFSFGLDMELDVKKLLDSIDDIKIKINYALDLPYVLQQNFCSLVRLGNLCPTEILFLIATFIGLALYTWQEIFSPEMLYGGKFLVDLALVGILRPLLNILQVDMRFGVKPLGVYAGCTLKTLTDLQDIDKATGQYGFKMEDLLGLVDGKAPSGGPNDPLLKGAAGALLKQSNLLVKSGDNEISIADEILKPLQQSLIKWTNSDQKFWSTVTNPLLGYGALDTLELAKGAIQDFGTKSYGKFAIVKSTVDAIDSLITVNSSARLELCAKLNGIGTMLSLLYGLFDGFKDVNMDACLKMPVEQDDPEKPSTWTLESPFNIQELSQMLNINNINYDELITPTGPNQEPGTAFVYNPVTDRRFNLTNCDKGKSSIISKGENLEFWKRVALGADVDNV